MQAQDIPLGYCQCGCGAKTRISQNTDRHKGSVRGQPRRFVHGHNRGLYGASLEQRFWSKVVKQGPDECWIWTGQLVGSEGYGRICRTPAHRVSYELFVGPVPASINVLHHCDNPPCVNPAHLFLGTHADNMADMTSKGRQRSKLTAAQIPAIRRAAAEGITQEDIAKSHGVTQATISRIISGAQWAYVS